MGAESQSQAHAASSTMQRVTELSETDLAARAGTARDRIRQMAQLGLIGELQGENHSYQVGDIERVRLLEAFEEAGISLTDMGRAVAEGRLSLSFLDQVLPEPVAMSRQSFGEFCQEIGVAQELVARLHVGFGFPRPRSEDPVREDDVEIYRMVPAIRTAGLTEAQLIRGVRVYGELIRHLVQFQVDLLHSYLEDPIRTAAASEREVMETAAGVSAQVRPIAEKLLLWLYRRHREHYTTKHLVEHAESLLEEAGLVHRDPKKEAAIAFVDLSGYTQLTEELGDEAAAEMASNLAVLVQEAASRHRGRPVKWLGDGVMFHFPDPADAIRCGLDLTEQAPVHELPRAHVGVNAGPVIFREGDYFGRTVNIASRIAEFARPGEVLVSDPVMTASQELDVAFSPIGPILLRGLVQPVNLYAAYWRADGGGTTA
jgi:adenylate cyclase